MQESVNSEVNLNSTMLASKTFNNILEQVQTSCLNFQLQISPFSAVISIKKSFIKDKFGNELLPSPSPPAHRHELSESIEALLDKNTQLENDVFDLTKKYQDAANDFLNAQKVIKDLEKKIFEVEEVRFEKEILMQEQIENLSSVNADRDQEIRTLQLANKTSKEALQKLNKSTKENGNKLEKKNTQLNKANKEIIDIKKRLDEKDAKIVELKKTNVELEEKLVSLLDVLYGCEECGRHGDYCECNNLIEHNLLEGDGAPVPDPVCLSHSPPSSTHSETFKSPSVSPPTSTTAQWTPPPTPPCSSCGGINYGPCPENVCFVCIPALKARSCSPPTRTPPGTPPLLRRNIQPVLGNMPASFSEK